MISQYKAYIHAELLPSRTEASLGASSVGTYQFFTNLGHQIQFQVLDNECPASLLKLFQQQHVTVQRVPPTQKRTNKAERAIQTFRRHFFSSVLVGTHPNFSINQWHNLFPQTEWMLNMLHAWLDNMNVSAYHGLHRQPYDHDPVREKWDN